MSYDPYYGDSPLPAGEFPGGDLGPAGVPGQPPETSEEMLLRAIRNPGAGMAAQAGWARQQAQGMPPNTPVMRRHTYRDNMYPIWPPTIVLPDPALFPHLRERRFNLTLYSTTSATIAGSVQFPYWCSIYAIAGRARVHIQDEDTYSNDLVELEMKRNTGDELTVGGITVLGNIVGDGQRPCPIGGPAWPFFANNRLMVNGVAASTNWKLWLTFYAICSIEETNVGMSRTGQFNADGR